MGGKGSSGVRGVGAFLREGKDERAVLFCFPSSLCCAVSLVLSCEH